MNGKVLAIGILLFSILACIAVYFVFQMTLKNEENGFEQTVAVIENESIVYNLIV